MRESQGATLQRLRAVEEALTVPPARGDGTASAEGLERTAGALLVVLSELGEVTKDLYEQASALRSAGAGGADQLGAQRGGGCLQVPRRGQDAQAREVRRP